MVNVRVQAPENNKLAPKITVFGVGGAGCNAVNNMISNGLEGAQFVVCNTDAQALQACLADEKIQLGEHVTGGLGAGANPDVGRAAAEESIDKITAALQGANMVFVTAGMGGGTGTGAAAVVARAARDLGILTIGVVTKPFHFEGVRRMKMAEQGIEDMQDYVDTLIVIPNQNLYRVANEKTTFSEGFKMADTVLQSAVRGVTDLMVMPGLINLDFADIRSVMQEMGKAMMGTGEAEGERRAIDAAEAAISNPLLDDVSMKGARGVIINITGGYDMTLFEVDEACNRIREEVDEEANIIFGSTFDEALEGVMRVSVVATGIDVEQDMIMGANRDGQHQMAGGQPAMRQDMMQGSSSGYAGATSPTGVPVPSRMTGGQSAGAGQAPRFERAIPQTTMPQTSSFPYAARQTTSAGSPATSARPEANATAAVTTTTTATKAVTAARSGDVSGAPRQSALASGQNLRSESQSIPRGQRVGEAFIPPQPMRADQVMDHMGDMDVSMDNHTMAQETSQPATAAAAIAPSASVAPGATGVQSSMQDMNNQPREREIIRPNNEAQYAGHGDMVAEPQSSKGSMIGNFLDRLTGGYHARQAAMAQSRQQARQQAQQQAQQLSQQHGDKTAQNTQPSMASKTYGRSDLMMNDRHNMAGSADPSLAPTPSGSVQGSTQGGLAQGPAQGKLNIDAPAAAPVSSQGDLDDELDIPAFLRRQAS